MRAMLTIALSVLLALTSSAGAFDREPGRPPPTAPHVEGELLVKFDKAAPQSSIAAAHAEVGATEMRRFPNVEGLTLVQLPAGASEDAALERYRKRPDVKYATLNYKRHLASVPNDTLFGSLWGLQNNGQGGGTPGVDIGATKAWDITTGSRDIVIAVIDSGIDYNHPDLAANMWRNVADCYTDGIDHDGNGYINDCYGINPAYKNSDPMDDTIDSHGTHVAGVIGALGNNSEGVVGVVWQVSLMGCKAFDRLEQGSDANIIACLDYVHTMKQRGVNIVATNNSYGGAGYDPALYDAIATQMNDGTLFITTAGDTAFDGDNPDGAFYPRDYDLPNIISVTAIDRFDKMWRYSGFGRHTVHLCAPGDIIWSTVRGNGYNFSSGTSEATAYATGVAALLKAQDPSRDWRAIKNLILAGGVNDPACSNILQSTITGKRLNAYGSLTCQNSTVLSRFRPAGSGWTPMNIPMGTQFALEVLNINCAVPNGPVNVTIQPGDIPVALHDDGVWPDHAAGDGIFSAEIAATRVGSYTLVFPNGDNWQANVIPAYTYKVDTFNWRTITGTNLNLSDDSTATVNSPFSIRLGGASFSTVYVDSNGKLNFMFPESDYINVSLPNPYQGYSHVVFPWWDDLNPIQNTAGNVYWQVTGTAPQRELVFEWRNVSRASGCTDPTANVTFQVVLFEGSADVLYQYAQTTFGGPAACAAGDHGAHGTVGIQLVWPSAAQYSFDQPSLTDNLALRFTLVQ